MCSDPYRCQHACRVVTDGTDIMVSGSMDPVAQAVFDQLYRDCAAGVLECR